MQAVPVAVNVHPHKHKQPLGAMDVYVGARGMRKFPEARWASRVDGVKAIIAQKDLGERGWATMVRCWLPTHPDPRPLNLLPHIKPFNVTLRIKLNGVMKFRITNRHVRATCSRTIPWGKWDGFLFPWPHGDDYIVLEMAQAIVNTLQDPPEKDEAKGPPRQSAITGILLPGQPEFEKVRARCRDAAGGDTKPV